MWVGERDIFPWNVQKISKNCFLKSCVTPSMRTNNAAHHIWVAVEKDYEKPDGNILSGNCICTAGLILK